MVHPLFFSINFFISFLRFVRNYNQTQYEEIFMKFQKLIVTVTSILCALILAFNAGAINNGSGWYIKRNGNKRPVIDKAQEIIYLTFDLGYDNGNTGKILDALKTEGIRAAFFLLDNIILKNTDLVTRMADEGHLLCNHTKNHKNLTSASNDEIEKNLTALESIYKEKTGRELSKYFRFPEGRYSESALKCVQSLGYKTIFWSFAYADWDNSTQPSKEKALKKILSNTHNGAVMLFHPTSCTNAEIFPTLIKAWKEMGYRFGTLDELTK